MREVFIVNATQVVTSESHPEGLFSVVSGFPKNFDSINYDDDTELALKAAKAEYHNRVGANYASTTRAMWTVTLEMSNGRQVMLESQGTFPVMPEPIPEPEEGN